VEAWMRGNLSVTGTRIARARAIDPGTDPRVTTMVAAVTGDHAVFDGQIDDALAWYATAQGTADPAWSFRIATTEVLALGYSADRDATSAADALLARSGDRRDHHAALAWYCAGEAVMDVDQALAHDRLTRAVELADDSGATFVSGIAATSLVSIEAV